MEKITYKFTDGTVSEVEVTEEFYKVHKELENKEKYSNRKNKRYAPFRRHKKDEFEEGEEEEDNKEKPQKDWRRTVKVLSLELCLENGIDAEDPNGALTEILAKKEAHDELHAAIATLTSSQQLLLRKVFWEGLSMAEIAREENVSRVAIHSRLQRILAKLKEILQEDR